MSDRSSQSPSNEDSPSKKRDEEIVEDLDLQKNQIEKTQNLNRDLKKQHFFTINPDEDLKMVKLKPYPQSKQLDEIFAQYKRIQQLNPTPEEIFLKFEDKQFQKERQLTIADVKALRKERNHKYIKFLIEVRKNFVDEELFSKFRKKVKVFSFDEKEAKKDDQNEESLEDSVEKESDVFSNYSEFY